MGWIKEIKRVNRWRNYSQFGEESYLDYIFKNIGTTNKYFVDLGAWDGEHLSNTKFFALKGWRGLLVDGKDFPGVYRSFITKENILETLQVNKVPAEFDLLSLDIDGNDYWILDEVLGKHKPRVIISEYNAEHPVNESKTIAYDPSFAFDNYSDYYGYTYAAGKKLAEKHGYTIIWQNSHLNLFYLRNDLVTEQPEYTIEQYRWWGGVNPNLCDKWVTI